MAHKDEIQDYMKGMNLAIMALSKTRLVPEIEDSELNVPGYDLVRCDGENRNTGGVVIYIRKDIKYQVIAKKKIESNC
ncbi:hypothetical protein P5V15_014697 [Pogonomyrmex californicus]